MSKTTRNFMIIFLVLCVPVLLMACTGNLPSGNSREQNTPTATPVPTEIVTKDDPTAVPNEPTQEAEPAAEIQQPETTPTELSAEIEQNDEKEENNTMQMKIGDTVVEVKWEENESVRALEELTAEKPLTIQMSMYGGFEQVGAIGRSLPRSDVQTTTNSGDIVLYSGNQIVVFYGSNSWAYTRLGHISDKTPQEMTALLSNGNVTITIGKGL